MQSHNTNKALTYSMFAAGGILGLWALAALIGGLHQVNWQVTELIRHYLVATGMIQPLHTLVDFYSHIKGIEYLICVAFFVAFPMFYKYVEKTDTRTRTTVQSKH
jgi:hypothetical protein